MKKSWGHFFRRVATACMVTVAGSGAWQSAICYASAASDSALDPVYDNGWQAGDNGGTGFGPWDFTGVNSAGSINAVDGINPDPVNADNSLGRAWQLANTTGP